MAGPAWFLITLERQCMISCFLLFQLGISEVGVQKSLLHWAKEQASKAAHVHFTLSFTNSYTGELTL